MKTLISQSYHSSIYFHAGENGKGEIRKVGRRNDPQAENRLQHELSLTRRFTTPHLRKALKLVSHQRQTALVLEYIPGNNLSARFRMLPLAAPLFLPVALKCLDLLAELQAENIIHNRIHPGNILAGDDNEFYLIDFAHAREMTFTASSSCDIRHTTEAISYFSPELTGQLRRRVDFRSDIYSLGVVFYELLTGQLPFYSKDRGELLHSIIAQPALPLRWINPSIPKPLEEIISKMLAKAPEDRYQSVAGLRCDLVYCLENLYTPERLCLLLPGQQDSSGTFSLSEKMYGKEASWKQMRDELHLVLQGKKAVITVTGKPGTGKTMLGDMLQQESLRLRANFIRGRFDLQHQGIPFYGILQALRELSSSILMEEEDKLAAWKEKLNTAAGDIGKVLTDLIPEFGHILEEQSEVPLLQGRESQNRLHYLLQRLIEHVARREHPLVMFLDDLHWADQSSHELIGSLIRCPKTAYFMIVLSFRKEEISGSKRMAFSGLQYASPAVTTLELDNLDRQATALWLQDSFCIPETASLAGLIGDKTAGNPFFIRRFLHLLYEDNLLYYDIKASRWKYDEAGILSCKATENVIDFLLSMLHDFSPACRHCLSHAACIGETFDARILEEVLPPRYPSLPALLAEACSHDFLRKEDNHQYHFVYGQIQEALLQQLGVKEKQQIHARIARYYLKVCSQSPRPEILFEFCRHLNEGRRELPASWRLLLININHRTGSLAMAKASFAPALVCFRAAAEWLQPSDWDHRYSTILDIYHRGAEAAAILGERDLAESWAREIILRGKNFEDKIKGKEIQLHILNENHEMDQAVDLLLSILRDLGYPMKRTPTPLYLIGGLILVKKALWRKKPEALLGLPRMEDARARIFMRLTARCTTSVFSAAPGLLPAITLKQVELSLRYGNDTYSPIGFASYGFALVSILGNLPRGYDFGRVSLQLSRHSGSKEAQAKVMAMFYGFISYWKEDIRDAIAPLKQAYHIGRETGDLLFASFATTFHSSLLFFVGEKLSKVRQLMEEDSQLIRGMHQELVYDVSENQRQFVARLTTPSPSPFEIKGAHDSEDEFVNKLTAKKDNATLFDFYVYKLILVYTLGEKMQAWEYAEKALEQEDQTTSRQITYPHFLLFAAISSMELYKKKPDRRYRRRITDSLAKLGKISRHAPSNFSAKYHLTAAAHASAVGKHKEALIQYSKAIQLASEHRFIHEEALGYELLGMEYLFYGEWSMAEICLQKAFDSYSRWGAETKCLQLKKKYPELIQSLDSYFLREEKRRAHIKTALKINRRLSSQLHLNDLASTLLHLALEHTGAERAVLLLKEMDESLQVKAIAGSGRIEVFPEGRQNLKDHLPVSIIHLVGRTEKPFMSADLSSETRFYRDSYFRNRKGRSVCCLPILIKKKLTSILYLENDLSDVFSRDSLRFLKSLSYQIAISLENALLFGAQEKIRELENNYNQNLLAVIHQTEENERRRISGELHDDIGALLSASKLYLSHPAGQASSPVQGKVIPLLDQATRNLRHISHRLSPVTLEHFGILPALRSLCKEIEEAGGIDIVIESNLEQRLSLPEEINLYRIFQELLSNTIKYSGASRVMIRMESSNGDLLCEYSDNGKGFDPGGTDHAASGKGIGIQNMRSRARVLKADFSLESGPGEGVKAMLKMNLNKKYLSKPENL